MVRRATEKDLPELTQYDVHIPAEAMRECIERGRVLVLDNGGETIGWLRYGFFWDTVPFMNMLFVLEEYRGTGCGRMLVEYWEREMKAAGYNSVMTSTQANEYSQHFYRKFGYADVGSFMPDGEPLELMLQKKLS